MLHELAVPAAATGLRLDVWLESRLEGCSRSLVARCIRDGHCSIAPGKAKPGWKLRGGEQIAIEVPEIEPLDLVAEDLPLTILHEDDHLIVVDKPAGMVVHPAIGHLRGTLVNALLGRYGHHLGDGAAWRPGLIHRLDADTSGVIVIARTAAILDACQDSFRQRLVDKRYLALIHGAPRTDFLESRAWLGRHPRDFRRRAVLPDRDPKAKEAHTTAIIRSRCDGYAIAEIRLHTGRTHQARVHLAHLGHPVLADHVYGRTHTWPVNGDHPHAIRRQALHAWRIDLPHPAGGRLVVEAPIPADLQPWIGTELRPL